MSKKIRLPGKEKRNNPVARHAFKINRSIVFQSPINYRRNSKHKGTEPFESLLQA